MVRITRDFKREQRNQTNLLGRFPLSGGVNGDDSGTDDEVAAINFYENNRFRPEVSANEERRRIGERQSLREQERVDQRQSAREQERVEQQERLARLRAQRATRLVKRARELAASPAERSGRAKMDFDEDGDSEMTGSGMYGDGHVRDVRLLRGRQPEHREFSRYLPPLHSLSVKQLITLRQEMFDDGNYQADRYPILQINQALTRQGYTGSGTARDSAGNKIVYKSVEEAISKRGKPSIKSLIKAGIKIRKYAQDDIDIDEEDTKATAKLLLDMKRR
jgi:hypothetical protein|tara:strand:- start:571 stop:1404 length:834 start_codon:yes stop_codon:yes gene_type:complete